MRLPFGGGKGGIKFDPHSVSKARAPAHHAPLHPRARREHRPRVRHPRARRRHQQPDHGVDDGHVLEHGRLGAEADGEGRRHRQARRQRRHARPRRRPPARASSTASLEWAKERGFNLEGSTMIVQGFGNVGSHTAVILSKLGVSTVAVGDHTGYMYNPEGFNAHKLQDHVEAARQHRRLPGRQAHHARGVLRARRPTSSLPARSRTRSARPRRRRSTCKLVAEGANGPCNPTGEKILLDARHRHPARRARQLGRRHRQLLRVGAEQALARRGPRKRSTRGSRGR